MVWDTQLANVQVLNDRIFCYLDEGSDYGAVILNSSGRLQLKVIDPVSKFLTTDEGILFKTGNEPSIKLIRNT